MEATLAERQRHTGGAGPVNVLGINSVYHESAAALVVDGTLVAAVEEERLNRIKHGKQAEFDNPHQTPRTCDPVLLEPRRAHRWRYRSCRILV